MRTIAEHLREAFKRNKVDEMDIYCADIIYYEEDEKQNFVLKFNENGSMNMSEEEYWDLLSHYPLGDGLGNGICPGSKVWTLGINTYHLFLLQESEGSLYWEYIDPFPSKLIDPNELWRSE